MALDILESPKITKKFTNKKSIVFILIYLTFGITVFTLAYMGMQQKTGLGTFNQPVLTWLISYRSESLTNIAKIVTSIANPINFTIITLTIVSIWAIYKREIWRPILLAFSVGLAVVLSTFFKTLIMYSRPPKVNMIPTYELDFSFPSGHTISVVVFLMVIGYLIYSRKYSIGRVIFWITIALLGSSVIAASRLYLGYHWLTDVVASIGLGFIILAMIIVIDRIFISKFDKLK